MVSFVNKVVEKSAKVNSEKPSFITVWKDDQFYVSHKGELYPIHDWDNLTLPHLTVCYSKPANDYWPAWYVKKPFNPNHSRPEIVKKWWTRYKPGMSLNGEIKDGVFYEHYISRDSTK